MPLLREGRVTSAPISLRNLKESQRRYARRGGPLASQVGIRRTRKDRVAAKRVRGQGVGGF